MSEIEIDAGVRNLYLSSDIVAVLGKTIEEDGKEQAVLRLWKGDLGKTTYYGQGNHFGLVFFQNNKIVGAWSAVGEPCEFNFMKSLTQTFGSGKIPTAENIETPIREIPYNLIYFGIVSLFLVSVMSWFAYQLALPNKKMQATRKSRRLI